MTSPLSKDSYEIDPNLDTRNVVDKYKGLKNEDIIKDLDKTRIPLHVAIENFQHDFNIGTVVRNANAFNVKAVHIIGKKHYNRRGAMVTDRYLHIYHHETVEDFVSEMRKQDYSIIAIDIVPGAKNLGDTSFPEKSVLIYGSEGSGLSKECTDLADKLVQIEQFGSTRSVNVGVASGITMYEYVRQHVLK